MTKEILLIKNILKQNIKMFLEETINLLQKDDLNKKL